MTAPSTGAAHDRLTLPAAVFGTCPLSGPAGTETIARALHAPGPGA